MWVSPPQVPFFFVRFHILLRPLARSPSCCSPQGTYVPDKGFDSCLTCPSGRYMDSVGASTCTMCPGRTFRYIPDGQTASAENATSCSLCAAGYVSVSTRLSCEPCSQGKYQSDDTCLSCDITLNRIQVKEGQPACDRCTPGFTASSAILCEACGVGYAHLNLDSNQCNACPPGYSTQGLTNTTTCTACGPGTYAAGYGTSQCLTCPAGYATAANASTSCGFCGNRTASPAGSSQCTPCSAGWIGSPGRDACLRCPPGRYANPDSNDNVCLTCSGNSMSTLNSTSCITW